VLESIRTEFKADLAIVQANSEVPGSHGLAKEELLRRSNEEVEEIVAEGAIGAIPAVGSGKKI